MNYKDIIKDKSLADLDSLPEPDVLAADIIENLQMHWRAFRRCRPGWENERKVLDTKCDTMYNIGRRDNDVEVG